MSRDSDAMYGFDADAADAQDEYERRRRPWWRRLLFWR